MRIGLAQITISILFGLCACGVQSESGELKDEAKADALIFFQESLRPLQYEYAPQENEFFDALARVQERCKIRADIFATPVFDKRYRLGIDLFIEDKDQAKIDISPIRFAPFTIAATLPFSYSAHRSPNGVYYSETRQLQDRITSIIRYDAAIRAACHSDSGN